MKALALAGLLVPLALLGCSPGDEVDDGGADPAPSPPTSTSSGPEALDLAATEVCDNVRRGVDAFNRGDVAGTIEQFREAVPLAERLARDEPSSRTETLRDAVRFYAGIPVDEYVEANASDPTFQRFKEFTLTECGYDGPLGPEDTGVPA